MLMDIVVRNNGLRNYEEIINVTKYYAMLRKL